MEEKDEHDFWHQPPPTESRAFMSSVWKGMKKIFKGQVWLKKQMVEQSAWLDHIEEGLRRSQSVGRALWPVRAVDEGDIFFTYLIFMHSYHIGYIEDNERDRRRGRVLT